MAEFIEIKPNKDWTQDLSDDLEGRFDRYVGELGVELRWRAARRTPVLTGRARGNWNLSFNQPNYDYQWDFYDPTGEFGDAIARVVAEDAKAGDVIFVCNGLPYITALNNGWSKKAPPGFVELTASEAPFIAEMVAMGQGESLHGRSDVMGIDEDNT